jgi:S-phase kinase-associated protein 1
MAEQVAKADGKTCHLVSSEGELFDVPLTVAKMSRLVTEMVDEDQEEDDEPQSIPLLNVKTAVLAKVVEFCRHYQGDPMKEIEKVGHGNY